MNRERGTGREDLNNSGVHTHPLGPGINATNSATTTEKVTGEGRAETTTAMNAKAVRRETAGHVRADRNSVFDNFGNIFFREPGIVRGIFRGFRGFLHGSVHGLHFMKRIDPGIISGEFQLRIFFCESGSTEIIWNSAGIPEIS